MRMGKQNARLRGTKTPRPIWAATALLLAGAALGSNAARSAELPLSIDLSHCPPEQSLRWRGGTLRLENDLFTGTDRNYTNGVALTLVSRDLQGALRPECLPRPIGWYARFIGWADPEFWRDSGAQASSQNLVVRFGQSMYTPEDKTRTDLIADDRPYAGLLYLGLAWNRRIHPQAGSGAGGRSGAGGAGQSHVAERDAVRQGGRGRLIADACSLDAASPTRLSWVNELEH